MTYKEKYEELAKRVDESYEKYKIASDEIQKVNGFFDIEVLEKYGKAYNNLYENQTKASDLLSAMQKARKKFSDNI